MSGQYINCSELTPGDVERIVREAHRARAEYLSNLLRRAGQRLAALGARRHSPRHGADGVPA